MEENSQFLTDAAKIELAEAGKSMCQAYSALSAEAFANDTRAWVFVPKWHILEHCLVEQASVFGNPRYFWTYPDEDLVGLSIEVAQSCHRNTLAIVSLAKWLILAFDVD
jgi:hypothetical protein